MRRLVFIALLSYPMKVRDQDKEEPVQRGGPASGGLGQRSGALSWGDAEDYLRSDEGGRH